MIYGWNLESANVKRINTAGYDLVDDGAKLFVQVSKDSSREKIKHSSSTATGNNVGKTTVLRLIDYCLGGSARQICSDPEGGRSYYGVVKEFLEEKRIVVALVLTPAFGSGPEGKVVIRRNFLRGGSCIREIDGENISAKDFTAALASYLLPSLPDSGKPSFRQVIGHNIRIDDFRLSHTLQFLHQNTKGVEYEAVYLYMLGCDQMGAVSKQNLADEKRAEVAFSKRLGMGFDRDHYRAVVDVLDSRIRQLEEKRGQFGVSDDFEELLSEHDALTLRIAKAQSEISRLDVRIGIIHDAEKTLRESRSSVDIEQLQSLYSEAASLIPSLQKTFEQLVEFHNGRIDERIGFIKSELPALEENRNAYGDELKLLLSRDADLSEELSSRITTEDARHLLSEINTCYQRKGESEGILKQLDESDARLKRIDSQIDAIEKGGEDAGLREKVNQRLALLNEEFGKVSNELYGETYFIRSLQKRDRAGVPYLSLKVDSTNVSTGKKQGEIPCFDIAYTHFADRTGIDCLHFLLNDKKELVHGNQLEKIDVVAKESNVQVVISMLHDKLPAKLSESDKNSVLSLSQDDKLFRIESKFS